MADITVAEFRETFGEFDGSSDEDIETALPVAYQLTDVSRDATLYVTAHLLALSAEYTGGPDGGSGVVKSERLGPKAVTYQIGAGDDERRVFFDRTSYGRMALTLEDRSPKAVMAMVVA